MLDVEIFPCPAGALTYHCTPKSSQSFVIRCLVLSGNIAIFAFKFPTSTYAPVSTLLLSIRSNYARDNKLVYNVRVTHTVGNVEATQGERSGSELLIQVEKFVFADMFRSFDLQGKGMCVCCSLLRTPLPVQDCLQALQQMHGLSSGGMYRRR